MRLFGIVPPPTKVVVRTISSGVFSREFIKFAVFSSSSTLL